MSPAVAAVYQAVPAMYPIVPAVYQAGGDLSPIVGDRGLKGGSVEGHDP